MGDTDIDQPSPYRIYDYLLGGSFNFAADRAFAHELLARLPWARDIARFNRAFLNRVVRYTIGRGVTQFLDLGSGIPTVDRLDQVARAQCPDCRIVYVDSNPVAVAHADVLLDGDDQAIALRADIRDVRSVLGNREITRLLDFDRPVVLLMGAVVHFFPDSDDPTGMIAAYRDAVAPGSVLALSHGTVENVPDEVVKAAPMYSSAAEPARFRDRAEVTGFFAGWQLVEPGVVFTCEWRPDYPDEVPADPGRAAFLAGVGIRP